MPRIPYLKSLSKYERQLINLLADSPEYLRQVPLNTIFSDQKNIGRNILLYKFKEVFSIGSIEIQDKIDLECSGLRPLVMHGCHIAYGIFLPKCKLKISKNYVIAIRKQTDLFKGVSLQLLESGLCIIGNKDASVITTDTSFLTPLAPF